MTTGAPPSAFVVPAHPPPSSPRPRPDADGGQTPERPERLSPEARAAPFRFELLSELALAALSVSAVLSLDRLFEDASFVAPLILIALLGHGASAALRHRQVAPAGVALIGTAAGVAVLSWVLYPATTFYGLPTADTLSTAADDLSKAWDLFGRVAAPAPVATGFVLASALAVWVMVWFSDWAAFRLEAVVEATLPAGAVFIFGAMLGAPKHRTVSTLVFVGALLVFFLAHRVARQARSGTWVGNGAASGGRTNLARGLAVVLVAVLVAGVIGPRLPGTGAPALIDWRDRANGPGTRVTVSPLVDIRKRLVDQSDTELFSVRSNRRAYWRLTSLETFDGTVWSSSGSFAEADGELPADDQRPSAATLTQDFRILDLAAIWLPAAFNPTSVSTDGTRVRWDDDSSTLIVDAESTTSDNITYSVESNIPRVERADLRRNDGAIPLSIAARYTDLPGDFPAAVSLLAETITTSGADPYAKSLLLQDFFRNGFTYDINAEAGHSDSAIESFLDSKRGYCEQFAGTFAAMARSLGLPARVAVGFTPGEVDPESVDRYVVKGRYAHAWPEVYFSQVGWVAFEPTPGRGAPGAEDYTGVVEAQDDGNAVRTTTTSTTAASSIPQDPGLTSLTSPFERLDAGAQGFGADRGGLSGPQQLLRVLLFAVLAAIAWVVALSLARILRRAWRRRGAATPAERVHLSWQESTETAATVGPRVQPWETHDEYVGRAGGRLGPVAVPLRRLAEIASVVTWSAQGADEAAADEADRLTAEIHRRAKSQVAARQKFRAALDPRPLLRS